MDAKRTLRLRKDVLAELAHDELESVVGGVAQTIPFSNCNSCPYFSCIFRCLPRTIAC